MFLCPRLECTTKLDTATNKVGKKGHGDNIFSNFASQKQ